MENVQDIHSPLSSSFVRKKRRFLDSIFHLISSLRSSSSSSIKREILPPMINDEKIRSTTSRCRRSSVARNVNQHSSNESVDNALIKHIPLPDKNSSKTTSKCNHSRLSHRVSSSRSKKKPRSAFRRKRNHLHTSKQQHPNLISLSNSKELPLGSLSASCPEDKLTDVSFKVRSISKSNLFCLTINLFSSLSLINLYHFVFV